MALNIDINATSVFAARDAVRELEQEYENLNAQIDELNSIQRTNNGLNQTQSAQLNTLTSEMNGLNVQMNEYYQTIEEIDANNLTASFEDMYGAVKPLSTQIGELEDRLYQMRLAGESNSEEFAIITERVGVMRQAIRETDMQIDIMAANKGISGLSDQFGVLGTSLLSLDFDSANASLAGMKNTLSNIDPAKTAKSFIEFGKSLSGALVQGVKLATTATWQFTVALLANPIVLIAVGVIALGAALYLLYDKFEPVKQLVDALTAPLVWLFDTIKYGIQIMKDFTDSLGLTNYAEQEAAEAAVQAAKKVEEAETLKANSKQSGLNRELKILEARGVNTEEEIKDQLRLKNRILQLEQVKIKAKGKTVEAEIALLKIKGDLSEEETQQLKDQEAALDDLLQAHKDIDTEIKVNKISARKQIQTIDDNANKTALDKQKAYNDKAKAAAEKAEDDIIKLRKSALQTIQKINDYYFDKQFKEQYEKEYQTTKQALEREEKLVLENTQLTEEERLKIKEYYTDLNKANEDKRTKDIIDSNDKSANEILSNDKVINQKLLEQKKKLLQQELDAEKEGTQEYRDAIDKLNEESFNQELKNLKDEETELLKNTDLTEQQKLDIISYYNDEEKNLEEQHLKEMSDLADQYAEEDKEREREKWNNVVNSTLEGFSMVANAQQQGWLDLAGSTLEGVNSMLAIFDDESLTQGEKMAGIAGAALNMVTSVLDQISQANAAKTEELVASLDTNTEASIGRLDESLKGGIISQQEYEQQKYQLELAAFNKEEQIRKKAFEQDKKLKIAQATIATIQGALTAFTGAMQLGPIAGPIVGGILAAAVGVMGGINIAKIKNSKYQGGTPPSAPSIPSINVPTDIGDDRGVESGQTNESSQSGSRDAGQAVTVNSNVNATVSVTELETVQNRTNKYEKNGEL